MATRTRRKPRAGAKPLTLQQIEAGIAAWSRDELLDFALEVIHHDHDLMEAAEVKILAKQAGPMALGRFKARIDDVLDVSDIGWREVDAYVRRLDRILDEIVNLGRTEPQAALEAALYFLEQVPSINDAIEDECELAMFDDDLGKAIVDLAKKANVDLVETGRVLLDAYMADGYGRMHDYPEHLGILTTRKADKERLAEIARDHAGRVDEKYMQDPLLKLARKLTSPSKKTRKKAKKSR